MDLDLSFFSWDLMQRYVLGGFLFSLQLTVVASIGGLLLGPGLYILFDRLLDVVLPLGTLWAFR